jgi:hypothetical protein
LNSFLWFSCRAIFWFFPCRSWHCDTPSLSILLARTTAFSVLFRVLQKSMFYLFIAQSALNSSWGPERLRTGGWSLLVVMSDWQRGVDWLLAEYCRCRLRLDLCWCSWRVGTKGLCLAGHPRSGEMGWPDSRDPVASGVKCGPHGVEKSKTKPWTGDRAG